MFRRSIVAAAVAAGSLGGLALAMPAAHAAGPSLCATVDVNVNGQGSGGPQTVCLPPAGTPGLPGLPGVPTLPSPPALP